MFSFVSTLVHISRPHIWLYTVGPFLFGILAAMAGGSAPSWAWSMTALLTMTVPINLFIYAVNDYFDAVTDAKNPKKSQLEYRANIREYRLLGFALVGLVATLPIFTAAHWSVLLLCALWLILIITYNVPPLRYKARPGFDLLLAFNYPLLGITSYTMVAGQMPGWFVLVPIVLLSISFHVYSAIHDMPHDKTGGVITTALWLGSAERALWLCTWCALAAAASFLWISWWFVALSLLPYAVFFLSHMYGTSLLNDALRSYTYFIRLQYIVGFIAGGTILWYLGLFI